MGESSDDAFSFDLRGQRMTVVSRPQSTRPEGLSVAEIEVFDALLKGLSDAEIAALRGTVQRTASNQVARLFAKLCVTSRREFWAKYA